MKKTSKSEIQQDEDVGFWYRIHFETGNDLFGCDDPEEYLTHIYATILACTEDGTETPAGYLKAYRVEIDQIMEDGNWNVFDAMDTVDTHLADCYSAMFQDKDGTFRKQLKLEGLCLGPDLLVFETIKILPEHRGNGLGHAATVKTMKLFGQGRAAAVLKPMALQHSRCEDDHTVFGKELGFDAQAQHARRDSQKVRIHWKKLGFVEVPGNKDFLYNDLGLKMPSLNETQGRASK